MYKYSIFAIILMTFLNCKQKKDQDVITMSADEIINKSIIGAGGKLFDHAQIDFDFREIHYRATRDYGKFQLERYIRDSVSETRDVLSNSGFERFVDGKIETLPDSLISKYSNSVNSVHYFAILPYGLDSKSVHKEHLGLSTIKGNDYHKIKVTFSEEGGGDDFEDEYVYWIQKENFTVDYLAYSYVENDGSPGFRFREAYNARTVDGLRFVDYDNYKPNSTGIKLEEMDDLFNDGKLKLLSKIELENIEVKKLN